MISLVLLVLLQAPPGFADKQSKASRVRQARESKTEQIKALFADAKVSYPAERLLLRAFKLEGELELWAGPKDGPMTLLKTYPVCAKSGTLGPKRRRGDLQVPEGFYHVDRYNAWSDFHLSLGVNYPNDSDRILGYKKNLGGDIFIHGDCVTIGCIPIEDEPIKELYLIALDTFLAGQRVHVHIFPRRMDQAGMKVLAELAGDNTRLLNFWRGLQPGYALFEEHRQLPKVRVDKKTGKYRISQ